MPCPHNEITIVQRSQRQSAVAAAAYQSGEKLFCEYDQQVKHYPEKRGSQKDIILYSTVRSSGNKYGIGFLKSEARINVAFSRARCLLIIVGDMKFLDNYKIRGNKFPEIIKYITESEGCRIIEK